MERASAAILLRCLRGKGKAEGQTDKPQGQTDEDACLPGLQKRISIIPARCTFLLECVPAIDVPPPEPPLARLLVASVEAVYFHRSDAASSCTNRFSPSSALQKSDLKQTAKNRPRMFASRGGQARAKAIIGQPRFSDLSRSHRKFGQAEAEADCVPQHDEQRVPIDFELRPLMSAQRVLDGEIMQSEALLHRAQQQLSLGASLRDTARPRRIRIPILHCVSPPPVTRAGRACRNVAEANC